MKRTIVFSCGILGAILFITASILGGLQIEGYSFISQYISESYAAGLPNTSYLRYMYVVSGLLLGLFAFIGSSVLPASKAAKTGFVLFGIFYGLGTLTTGFFPCDIGCNPDAEDATLSQFIHNTVGFLVYSIVPLSLIGIGMAARKWKGTLNISSYSLVCGLVSLVAVVVLFGDPTGPLIGLYQRIIEGSILVWVLRTAFFLRKA